MTDVYDGLTLKIIRDNRHKPFIKSEFVKLKKTFDERFDYVVDSGTLCRVGLTKTEIKYRIENGLCEPVGSTIKWSNEALIFCDVCEQNFDDPTKNFPHEKIWGIGMFTKIKVLNCGILKIEHNCEVLFSTINPEEAERAVKVAKHLADF